MKKVLILGIGATCLALLGSSAHAALVETQTKTFENIPNYNYQAVFDQFDTLGGTRELLSINVELMVNVSQAPRLGIDNDAPTGSSGNVEFGVKGSISSADVVLSSGFQTFNLERSFVNSESIILDPDDGDTEVGGTAYFSATGNDYAFLSGLSGSSSASANVASGAWGLGNKGFLGSGTFVITANLSEYSDTSSIGGVQKLTDPAYTNGSITVTYNYIPEPASMLVLGMAAVGVIYYRRRISKQSKIRGELDEELYDDEPEA
jgi:hypothetical protein